MQALILFFKGHEQLVAFLAALLLLVVYKPITEIIRGEREKGKSSAASGRVKKRLSAWRGFFFILLITLLLKGLGGRLVSAGILSAAFLGMVLGWSLQQPITGVAAWILVGINRPFKVGDRVILVAHGLIGDVRRIGPMYVTLEQVGGTVGGEEVSKRAILIPTAMLFGQVVINYTMRDESVPESKYILDEVPVRITYESKWEAAEKILLDAARKATKDIIAETGSEPYIRAEFLDWGFLMRLRYLTKAADRQEISTNIVKIIFHEFAKSKEVEFCYPHSEVIYKAKDKPPFVS